MAEAAISKALSIITEQAVFLYGVDEQVRSLVTELARMRSFLKDVESRRHKEERVRNWAEEIKVLAQDSETTIVKFALRHKKGEDVTCFITILVRVVCEVVARFKTGREIEKINQRIKNLTASLQTYGIVGISEGESSVDEVILQSGAIAVERWGGPGGSHWSYRPKGLVKQIIVKHGVVIDSIMFKSIQENGVIDSSQTFGGRGGNRSTEINIDCPSEYLKGISGTFGVVGSNVLITSLKLHTNLTEHGPFGTARETDTNFSLVMQGGVVVGFHGRKGLYLDAIGLYIIPARITLLSQYSNW